VDAVFYVCVGAGFSQVNSSTALSLSGYTNYWGLNNVANDATTPDDVGGMTGTKTSPATLAATGKHGKCAQMTGGNGGFNNGDIAAFNSVTQFTIELMLNTTSTSTQSFVFRKYLDATHLIDCYIASTGRLYIRVFNGAASNAYVSSGVIVAGNWHHVVFSINLSLATDVLKVKVFVDGVQRTLTFATAFPTVTANLAGVQHYLGDTATSASFLGKQDSYGIMSTAATAAFVQTRYNMFFDSGFWAVTTEKNNTSMTFNKMSLSLSLGF
jgi:hypothetical protein